MSLTKTPNSKYVDCFAVINESEALKSDYDQSFAVLASQQKVFEVKKAVGALLCKEAAESTDTSFPELDKRVDNLAAHQLDKDTVKVGMDLIDLNHVIEDSRIATEQRASEANEHFAANEAIYFDYARRLAASGGQQIINSVDPEHLDSTVPYYFL